MTKQMGIECKEAKEERERIWEVQMKKEREQKEKHGRHAELIRANVHSGGNGSCESSMKDNILRRINQMKDSDDWIFLLVHWRKP